MIEDVLDLSDRAARTIMTPRPDIVWMMSMASRTQRSKRSATVPSLSFWFAAGHWMMSLALSVSRTS